MGRKDSTFKYFIKRIPRDVKGLAVGVKLAVPVGNTTILKTISARDETVRLSLRTRDPSEFRIRHAVATAYLERVWNGLRQGRPVSLSPPQVHALAGELFHVWQDDTRGRTIAMEHTPSGWRRFHETPAERAEEWEALKDKWSSLSEAEDASVLEPLLGPIIDRLLLTKGISSVDAETRRELLWAFAQALRDAFTLRQSKARGDYSPNPISQRFPQWEDLTKSEASPKCSLTGLVEDWWKEAQAGGLAVSTYESYRNTMRRFVSFLGHDDASRVTPEDILRFKDHRLKEINPRSGKTISAKTIKDSDLAALKTVFQWAVVNRRMVSNPAAGITIKIRRMGATRSKSYTEEEAIAVLSHSLKAKRGREREKTFSAKRWVPWLCAYTGARVGEMVQLRKCDVWQERSHWFATITPEAGTVKDKQVREVPLHRHLVELGFPEFVEAAADGHLFLTVSQETGVRGPWKGVKSRVRVFVREVIKDPRVAPNHAWRHLFKTIGREAGIEDSVLDAISGHAAKTVGGRYGEVSRTALVKAIEKFPRFPVGNGLQEKGA